MDWTLRLGWLAVETGLLAGFELSDGTYVLVARLGGDAEPLRIDDQALIAARDERGPPDPPDEGPEFGFIAWLPTVAVEADGEFDADAYAGHVAERSRSRLAGPAYELDAAVYEAFSEIALDGLVADCRGQDLVVASSRRGRARRTALPRSPISVDRRTTRRSPP